MSFICHIHNYTEYNVFSAFNPSKCTHTRSSGQPTLQRPGSSWGFGALLKAQSWTLPARAGIRTHNLGLPRVSSPTLYPLGHDWPSCGFVTEWGRVWTKLEFIYIFFKSTSHTVFKFLVFIVVIIIIILWLFYLFSCKALLIAIVY